MEFTIKMKLGIRKSFFIPKNAFFLTFSNSQCCSEIKKKNVMMVMANTIFALPSVAIATFILHTSPPLSQAVAAQNSVSELIS